MNADTVESNGGMNSSTSINTVSSILSPATSIVVGGSPNSATMSGDGSPTHPSTPHHRFLHTIQFHPRRRIAFIERLPGSVLIHSLGPYLTGDEMLRLGFSSGRIMNSLHYDFSYTPYQYQPTTSNDIWCLKVIQRHYPHERTYCRYFSTKREAEEAELDEQRDFIDEYRSDHDGQEMCPYTGDKGPDDEDEDAKNSRLDAKFEHYVGQWSYYDAPFESEIFKVKVEAKGGTNQQIVTPSESEKSDEDVISQADDDDDDDDGQEDEEEFLNRLSLSTRTKCRMKCST